MVFTGNANPAWHAEIARPFGHLTGLRQRWAGFSDGEVTVEINQNVRARDVFVVQSTCAPDQRKPDGIADHGRCAQARLGRTHQRRHPLLRLCPAGPPPALDPCADHRQGGRQHAADRRRRAGADHGPACRPDPGLLRHPGGQHLRLPGAAGRHAPEELRRPDRGLARRRRRGARTRPGQAAGLRPGHHRQAPPKRQCDAR